MNLLLTFTYNSSLKDWDNIGILNREILLYKNLSQKGIKVNFLTYGDKTDLQYTDFLKNIQIIPIQNHIRFKKIFFLMTLLFPLFNYKLFKKIDIIKTNQMEGSWLTWVLKIIYRKKIIVRCGFEAFKNRFYEYRLLKKKRKLLKLIFLFIVEWISYRLSNRIIVSNNFDKNFVIKYFKINANKISILPNHIDTEVFRTIPVKKKVKAVLFVGRLRKVKNLENLIDTFNYLDGYTLDIIGEGKIKPLLVDKIKKSNLQSKINFLGIFPNFEMPKIINQYNLFILPSLWEGNPKSLLEAMSCGVACIGANIPGIKEIIEHKQNGYLCNTDSKSIAKAIKKVYENPALMDSLAKNGRDYVIKHHSISKITEREIEIYQSLLKKC